MSLQFPRLLQPFRLGQLELRNRIVMPPMATRFSSEDGFVTEQLRDYYAARARGGVGLVIVEASCVDAPAGKGWQSQLMIDDDRFVRGLAELVHVVKEQGAKIAIQLHHAGSEARSSITGVQPVAPSPIPRPDREMPRELTTEEVSELVLRFATAAQRADSAGFDGVEIHGAHGYLVAQFLSSFFNKRSDVYGGGIERRASFLSEIIQRTKELAGREYPVWCRMNGREFGAQAGLSTEEAQEVARMVQNAGAEAINVSVMAYGVSPRTAPPMAQPPGNLVRFAEAIKSVISIPVIAVGRIDPATSETVIEEGRADLIAVGRALIADPELPNKAASGKLDDIRPCIGCQTCLDCITTWHEPVRCVVNPAVGKERECAVQRADSPKKVFVVGGGPAGMEAARVSALRGHNVVLYDRGETLGGQLLLASIPPYKEVLETFANYQRTQLSRVGVKVELGQEVSAALVEEAKPDAVILATGMRLLVPQIPGVDRSNVVSALDVLAGKVEVGNKVAVIGAEVVGCETAEFLAEKGKKVTLMRRGEGMATKLNPTSREHLLARLEAKGVTMLTGVQYQEITDEGVIITTRQAESQTVEADTVVLAAGSLPDTELYEALKGKVPELCLVGDCVEPRDVMSAVA
ncbi:MAG: FAD-dependent oxidoreductase, partial [Dehalococcoidia bacterium]|nr:FAD-dependent oxidoreductase [Dehalococcoidia bacterium]